jgi:hypothetical protein
MKILLNHKLPPKNKEAWHVRIIVMFIQKQMVKKTVEIENALKFTKSAVFNKI